MHIHVVGAIPIRIKVQLYLLQHQNCIAIAIVCWAFEPSNLRFKAHLANGFLNGYIYKKSKIEMK